MKANITVSSREEAADISAGLALPDIRAITVVAGLLDPMPYPARKRILVYLPTPKTLTRGAD